MNKFIINVATNGQHYCRIELPDTNEEIARLKAKTIEMAMRYALGDSVSVTMTAWKNVGQNVDF